MIQEMPGGSGRVLLVEDEEGVRAGLTMLLEMIGYEVIAVGSGEEAIAIVMEPPPDLLLSDLTLPGIVGSTVAERLCERWPSLKVVLMSGYSEDDALLANVSTHGWHFLRKPFEIKDLASHVQEALGERVAFTASFQNPSQSAVTDEASRLTDVSGLETTRPEVA